MNSPRRLLTLIAAIALLPAACFGWGREGHRIIATVAEDHLSEQANVMVQSLIGNNHLYSFANWADDIRRQRSETAPWHYVKIPLGATYNAKQPTVDSTRTTHHDSQHIAFAVTALLDVLARFRRCAGKVLSIFDPSSCK
jgi:hypothetical protein